MILTPNPTPPRTPLNPGPVMSAGAVQVALQVTPMPQMRGTLQGWFHMMVVNRVSTEVQEDGTVVRQELPINTSGVLQPGTFEELDLQAGGDRSWKYWMLHCVPNLRAQTNDLIRIQGILYRVMSRKDYTLNGYIEYRLVEAPENGI